MVKMRFLKEEGRAEEDSGLNLGSTHWGICQRRSQRKKPRGRPSEQERSREKMKDVGRHRKDLASVVLEAVPRSQNMQSY